MPASDRKTCDDVLAIIARERLKVDTDLLRLAYETAAEAHQGQTRFSGEPYVTHPLAVAAKLATLKLDEETIIAGLLHDVPEDTAVTIDQVRKDFGGTVAQLVEGVTKLGTLKYRGMERYVENLRRMFIAMAQDIRVILIRFADRIHNLETLEHHPQPEKRKRIAVESIEIYAPIANRLGMGDIKGQLEDLAFPFVDRKAYEKTAAMLKNRLGDITGFIEGLSGTIRDELKRHGVTVVDIHGRQKHLYSLYRKLQRPDIGNDITKIYDLLAIRIIVPDVNACYGALGIIHGLWKPLPNRIKDYIAQPKPSGYQSIHTTVFGPDGRIVEIQIRDTAMHESAEHGITAHWHYDESGKTDDMKGVIDRKLSWVRELTEWQREIENEEQYLEALKIDVFSNRIFCFTPKGDVIDLPEGASAVDFAYAVHTDLGSQIVGARVNGKFEPVTTTLKSGDVVEAVIDKNRTAPNPDWLPFVKTGLAREKIRKSLKNESENLLSEKPGS